MSAGDAISRWIDRMSLGRLVQLVAVPAGLGTIGYALGGAKGARTGVTIGIGLDILSEGAVIAMESAEMLDEHGQLRIPTGFNQETGQFTYAEVTGG
jgi:hypothetical protein